MEFSTKWQQQASRWCVQVCVAPSHDHNSSSFNSVLVQNHWQPKSLNVHLMIHCTARGHRGHTSHRLPLRTTQHATLASKLCRDTYRFTPQRSVSQPRSACAQYSKTATFFVLIALPLRAPPSSVSPNANGINQNQNAFACQPPGLGATF
jgi:hypothetical protein